LLIEKGFKLKEYSPEKAGRRGLNSPWPPHPYYLQVVAAKIETSTFSFFHLC
jgi:hypothetical protein